MARHPPEVEPPRHLVRGEAGAAEGLQLGRRRMASVRNQLDEEAIRVMELQRGYQSMSKMISVINGLADTLMQMV